jgi:hypothetical protein
MCTQEILSAYLEDYFEAMAGLSCRDVARRQSGLFASLAFGAAGIAYAHWYAGFVLGDTDLLQRAEEWSRSAITRHRNPLAFLGPPGGRGMPPGAFLYGRAGLYFVRVLSAHSRGATQAYHRAISRFVELGRLSRTGSAELYKGTAGCLTGTAILFAHVGDPRLLDLGSNLAEDLSHGVGWDQEGRASWRGLHGLGLAHGALGVYLSLLLWSAASGTDLPSWFSSSLTDLLEATLENPSRLCPEADHYSYLCNGFTGYAFLAAKAHQSLGGTFFVEAARRATILSLAHISSDPHLCCGRAGCAAALLALSRVDPSGPWRKRAEDLVLSTLLLDRKDWPYAGLYGGEAAIACLALNLTSGIPGGPPCLDFIEP